MKKQELWNHFVSQNPQFIGEGNVTLTKAGLYKLFNTTYDQAYKHAAEKATEVITEFGKELAADRRQRMKELEEFLDLFT